MLVGHLDKCTPTVIGGWAADNEAPEAVVSVVIYVDNRRVATVPCGRERPDLHVRSDLRGHVRHGFEYEFSPPLDLDRTGQISVRFERSGESLTNGERKGGRKPALSPILVTAIGRSGTTFLMNRLSQSSKICLVELSPFEIRLLAYWSGVYQTLSAPANFERSTHPDLPTGDGFRIGSNPYSHVTYEDAFRVREVADDYFGRFVPDSLSDFIRGNINEYYSRLSVDQGKHDAVYFAEKTNNVDPDSRKTCYKLYPELKEIVLIRDPRDIYCSHLSYFNRNSEGIYADISYSCDELLKIFLSISDQQIVLRYEDMITDNATAFRNLSDFLGVPDLGRGNATKENAVFEIHATSKSPGDSIGRWRELPQGEIQRMNTIWGGFLQAFGYAR